MKVERKKKKKRRKDLLVQNEFNHKIINGLYNSMLS